MKKVGIQVSKPAMDETKTTNERSVELALGRELEYRNKLARLGLHPESTSRGPRPLQVSSSRFPVQASNPSSRPMPTNCQFRSPPLPSPISNRPSNLNPKPVGHNKKPIFTPPRTQNPIPKPIQKQNEKQIIPSSSRPMTPSTAASARPNLAGNKRKEMTSNVQGNQSSSQLECITMTPEGYSYCNLCEVPCSCSLNLQQHLKGNKHKNKLQLLEWTKRGVFRPSCDICHIFCSDMDLLEMHKKGQKHQSTLRKLEAGKEKKVHKPCELCGIWCMDEGAYQQHLKGKSHISRLFRGGNKTSCS